MPTDAATFTNRDWRYRCDIQEHKNGSYSKTEIVMSGLNWCRLTARVIKAELPLGKLAQFFHASCLRVKDNLNSVWVLNRTSMHNKMKTVISHPILTVLLPSISTSVTCLILSWLTPCRKKKKKKKRSHQKPRTQRVQKQAHAGMFWESWQDCRWQRDLGFGTSAAY